MDFEDDWTYSYKFDFVFGRMLTGSIADWPRFIQQSYEYVVDNNLRRAALYFEETNLAQISRARRMD
ncbi:hypothetical protein ColLi_01112 [Colletotrichum liriopes]|uniref:Uncharacterized protein n=1 Tax=Colletotrichum liriopes TaxID=708192 RepID=A0AA37GCP5_9PEZI|nr:hypothetical protein ColLi_01112 [Colletotrichum liriopes]